MIIFCKDKILVKGQAFEFDEDYIVERGNINIINTSKNLPAVWQVMPSWADVDMIESFLHGEKLISIREMLGLCDNEGKASISKAWQFRNWFKNISYCSHCGGRLSPSEKDFGRICDECGTEFYAPMSPAVITAVEKHGKLLLAHNVAWNNDRYSIIAGFVEPGERLEDAVRREIREEVSIEVKNIKYFGSQTWPFPNSLMLGFTAEYDSGEVKPDGAEISHADFFTPYEIRNMNIPDRASIARRLIDNFLDTY